MLDPGDRGTMILRNIRTTLKPHFTVPKVTVKCTYEQCLIAMDFTFPQLHVFQDYMLNFLREIYPILCCIISSQDFYLFRETILKDE